MLLSIFWSYTFRNCLFTCRMLKQLEIAKPSPCFVSYQPEHEYDDSAVQLLELLREHKLPDETADAGPSPPRDDVVETVDDDDDVDVDGRRCCLFRCCCLPLCLRPILLGIRVLLFSYIDMSTSLPASRSARSCLRSSFVIPSTPPASTRTF